MITLCVITLNSEEYIGRLLGVCSGHFEEIIVVDGGSTDKTLEICKIFEATVYYREWDNDYSEQRNYAISKAKSDWIFFLDADEYPDYSLISYIKYNLNKNNFKEDIYRLSFLNYFREDNYLPKEKLWKFPDFHNRLFRNKYKYNGKVHENLEIPEGTNIGEISPNFGSIVHEKRWMHQRRSDYRYDIQNKNLENYESRLCFRKNTLDEDIFKSVFYSNVYRLPDFLNPKSKIIDIGAHIGSFAYSCLVRGCDNIICFEPDIENFEILTKNLEQFKGKVKNENKAVWGNREVEKLYFSGFVMPNTGHGTVFFERINRPTYVRYVTLDEILVNYDNIDILKLDCEGSEYNIIYNTENLHKIKRIVGEYHEINNDFVPRKSLGSSLDISLCNFKSLKKYLQSNGFSVEDVNHNDTTGLFFADLLL